MCTFVVFDTHAHFFSQLSSLFSSPSAHLHLPLLTVLHLLFLSSFSPFSTSSSSPHRSPPSLLLLLLFLHHLHHPLSPPFTSFLLFFLSDLLNRRSSWSDEKDGILKLTRGPEYRILEDIEVKRAFQDFVSKLEKIYRDEERIKKQELQKKIDESSKHLKESFEKLVFDGLITPICRWKDWVGRPEVADNSHYQVIESLVNGKNEKDKNENTNVEANKRSERTDRIDRNEKYDSITASMTNTCRNLFENVLDDLSDNYKSDKRLIKDILEEKKYVITHDSTYAEFSALLHSVAGAKPVSVLTSERTDQEDNIKINDNSHNNGTKDKEKEREKDRDKEGDKDKYSKSDEKDKSSSGRKEKDFQKSVEIMMELRPKNPLFYFKEIYDKVFASYEEDRIRMKRKEDKYIALLQEFYNRSDHVGTEWEDAKVDLASYSEYSNLGRTDRKRLFQEYMTNLDGIMQAKTRSLHDSMLSEVKKSELENIQREKDQDKEHDSNHNQDVDNDEEAEREKNNSNDHDDKDREGGSGRERERDDDTRDLKKHRTHRDADEKDRERDRDRDHRGKDRDREEGEERERGDDSRSKDKVRDTDKRRSDTKDRDGEKNDVRRKDKDDYEEEGEEDGDGEDDGKKGKKRKKERSSKDKSERDKKHKKVCFNVFYVLHLQQSYVRYTFPLPFASTLTTS